MDQILKLFSIYKQSNVRKKLQLYEDHATHSNTLMNKILTILERSHISNESELVSKLYDTKPVSIAAYKKVKERLRNKLINIILLVDLKESGLSDRFAAYSDVIKLLLIGRVLTNTNEPQMGEDILEEAMYKSLKFDFLDLQHIISKLLTTHYGSISQDSQKYTIYNTLASSSLNELLLESEIRKASNEYFEQRLKSLSIIKSEQTDYSKYISLALSTIEKSQNSEIRNFAYALLLNCYIYTKNQKSYETVARQSLSFFLLEKKLGNNTFKKLSADIMNGSFLLRMFSFSDEIYHSYASYFNRKEHNWYVFAYYRILTNLHAGEFHQAFEVMISTIDQPDFKHQMESMQQHFRVLQAYFHFLQFQGKIPKEPDRTFRIKKFLNEVPLFSKEKRGMNISILVVQILILIVEKRIDEVSDRIDSLSLYSYRYLRKTEMWRTSCFIKMLGQLAKYSFNKRWAKSRIQPYYDKLVSVNISEFPGTIEIEIIPYEHLWDMILEKLD